MKGQDQPEEKQRELFYQTSKLQLRQLRKCDTDKLTKGTNYRTQKLIHTYMETWFTDIANQWEKNEFLINYAGTIGYPYLKKKKKKNYTFTSHHVQSHFQVG